MDKESIKPEKYRHDLEVVRNTAEQVIKDFQISGMEIYFSGNPTAAYDELRTQVRPLVEKMYSNQHQNLLNLLYRIDVYEKKIHSIPFSPGTSEYFDRLTELILEREFIKVLYRKLFGQGK